MNRLLRRGLTAAVAFALLLAREPTSLASIPVGYEGKPFDPAQVGGPGKIPPTVVAGPYPIPGRIDIINYDLGGDGVAYHTADHITDNGSESVKLALGYRTDTPTATLCLSNPVEKDSWYGTGTSLDGTSFPSSTTADYYIGAVRPGDWFNFTVDVQTAGTYTLSSTWASGNGPPGGEGGDGAMELQVFANGTLLADWQATFPNYETAATFHNWVPFAQFATVTLDAGMQVIQMKSTLAHLNMAYVEFDLATDGVDGGAGSSDAAPTAPSDAAANREDASGPSSPAEAGGGASGGDAAESSSAEVSSSCGCVTAGAKGRLENVELASALLLGALLCRRRRLRALGKSLLFAGTAAACSASGAHSGGQGTGIDSGATPSSSDGSSSGSTGAMDGAAAIDALASDQDAGSPLESGLPEDSASMVPPGYVGTPFKTLTIPGTIFLSDYDTGGPGVAYCHSPTATGAACADGIKNPPDWCCTGRGCNQAGPACPAYRTGADNAGLSQMNTAEPDDYPDGTPVSPYFPYLSYSATGEWSKYTVQVAQAGTYSVGGLMAAPRPPQNLTPTVSLDFGSGVTSGIFTVPSSECGSPDPGCTEGYHVWQTDDAMASVTFPAPGTYVMTFTLVSSFLNPGFFTFTKM